MTSQDINSCSLFIEAGEQQGQVYELCHPVVIIGRHRDNDIVFTDLLVARRHARLIRQEDGSYRIEDLHGLPTGIMLNGRRLNQHEIHPLQDGDRLHIGQTELVFRSSRR